MFGWGMSRKIIATVVIPQCYFIALRDLPRAIRRYPFTVGRTVAWRRHVEPLLRYLAQRKRRLSTEGSRSLVSKILLKNK